MKNTNAKERRRHEIVTAILRPLITAVAFLKLGYTCKKLKKSDTAMLVLSNHATDWDPILVQIAIKPYLCFVSSDHVYRQGFLSKLLKWAFAPIARQKGSTDAASAMAILRSLRGGTNVCIFAEGNRTWNGETGEVFQSTARLVRRSGASLVTFRLTGGYLTSPRWSDSMRRGKMHGECVSIIPPEQLKSMTEGEIAALIDRDLYENSDERQDAENIKFKGKNLAQSLETAIYTCPECGGVCTMKSEGNRFFCTSCGKSATLDEYGRFSGGRFRTVLEWDRFQSSRLPELALRTPYIYSDPNQTLFRVNDDGKSEIASGDMTLTATELSVGAFSLPVEAVTAIAMIRRTTLVFT
ncbi:MAG: 1-acyl-sn-glycerol-3-phosphate acyltransferase, partial [Oscillospiraceae bacterium]|nr:1-acyl-sn-glycerol-3-phosphate acyltransferase [Oscillospiraceae bacterium]